MPIRETLAGRVGTGIDGTAETFETRLTILSSEQDSAEDRSTDENVRLHQEELDRMISSPCLHQEIDIQQPCMHQKTEISRRAPGI